LLAIGFFLFSCFSLLNDSILERWLYDYDVLWNLAGTLVFIPCLLLWIWAVRETQPKTVLLPEMLPIAVYLEFAPEINFHLKALNEHLNQFWSAEARRP
jgi:cytosine/uracil/thiamine/allantoin permease